MIANIKRNETIPGIRKAAMLMVLLGEEASAGMIRELSEEEVQAVSREVARISTISNEEGEAILEEFYQMCVAREYVSRGGIEYARKVLMSAFGADTARKLVDRLVKTMGNDTAAFDALQKADPQQLAKFIHSEHPQTIAFILSHLSSSQAASLLISLPAQIRADVALRMAHLDQISPEIIHKIAAVIGQKLQALGDFSRESYGGVRAVSEMFNRLDSVASKEILESIEKENTALADTIRHLMFVFEDMLIIESTSLKEVLAKVDRKVLTLALKGTSEQVRKHFIECLSQRGAEMLLEDMEALGPVKIKDVESAQQQIIVVVRQLESDGTINLKGAGGEQYVV
ncbi:MAG TPA: flagellar motor switch protein FliG [Bryobacteraceae bacterium]|nr:flagellar motor switch protein FliG [Bryobacteraceae bacterium]